MKQFNTIFLGFIVAVFIYSCKPQATEPAASATTAASSIQVADKIVYVNMDTLLNKFDLYQAKIKELNGSEKVTTKDLEAKFLAFQKRAAKFQQEVAQIQQKAAEIAPVELKKLEERFTQQGINLKKEEEALLSQQEKASMDLDNKSMEALKEVQKNIDDCLDKLAKANGYELILRKGTGAAVMFGVSKLDITQTVITQLNEEFKTKNKK